ncbi:MAG: hypothetical protein HKP10_01105 [Kiritimatiellales bacterium]|nr:isoamylase early set domain-containing protein [Pontiella sp.]NNJ69867.1 hypothetical protein [Kiritimatiellales bacterium]
MNDEKKLIERLEQHRTRAPEGFADQVMDALPSFRKKKARGFWPTSGQWIAPALVGAAAAVLVLLGVGHFRPAEQMSQVGFHFELHAPGADKVELLGTFNNWQADDIVLAGPDASGHWTATVELPEGRHEYIFLVDGERWLADPRAATHRPDGFGRVNTVINIYEEENA